MRTLVGGLLIAVLLAALLALVFVALIEDNEPHLTADDMKCLTGPDRTTCASSRETRP